MASMHVDLCALHPLDPLRCRRQECRAGRMRYSTHMQPPRSSQLFSVPMDWSSSPRVLPSLRGTANVQQRRWRSSPVMISTHTTLLYSTVGYPRRNGLCRSSYIQYIGSTQYSSQQLGRGCFMSCKKNYACGYETMWRPVCQTDCTRYVVAFSIGILP